MDWLVKTAQGMMDFWGVAWVIAIVALILLFVAVMLGIKYYYKTEDLFIAYQELYKENQRLRKKVKK